MHVNAVLTQILSLLTDNAPPLSCFVSPNRQICVFKKGTCSFFYLESMHSAIWIG